MRRIALLMGLPILGLVAGIYLLATALSPAIIHLPLQKNTTAQRLQVVQPDAQGNRLYIPHIDVDVAIVQGDTSAVLEKGAWHRQPQNGDPIHGGNFVLSAHRFNMGFTPQQTRARSPFYNLHKLRIGDELIVDYQGKRFYYKIVKKYAVRPSQIEIEGPSTTPKLTLYSCKLQGAADGREVIEAEPT